MNWTGLLLFILYGFPAVSQAWKHIWQDHTWSLLQVGTALGIPYPLASLTTTACLLVLACAGLIAGFLTRVSAAVILLILIAAFSYLQGTGKPMELTLVYMTGPVALIILGAGHWSIDAMFKRR